jgi:4-alpha-glucanotransferase
MRILQFPFDRAEPSLGAGNRFLPHNHAADSVVYTGTHDNDTTRGWWAARRREERDSLERYCGATDPEIEWRLIRMAMASVCSAAVIPFQDVLGLGTETRMNTPGTSSGKNWTWRADDRCFDAAAANRPRLLSETYGRAREDERFIP